MIEFNIWPKSYVQVETILQKVPYVENICVYGASQYTFLIAFILPNEIQLQRLAQSLQMGEKSVQELCNDPSIIDAVMKSLLETAKKAKLRTVETPSKIKLCSDEWNSENGLLTPSMKIVRRKIYNNYKNDIALMYS